MTLIGFGLIVTFIVNVNLILIIALTCMTHLIFENIEWHIIYFCWAATDAKLFMRGLSRMKFYFYACIQITSTEQDWSVNLITML